MAAHNYEQLYKMILLTRSEAELHAAEDAVNEAGARPAIDEIRVFQALAAVRRATFVCDHAAAANRPVAEARLDVAKAELDVAEAKHDAAEGRRTGVRPRELQARDAAVRDRQRAVDALRLGTGQGHVGSNGKRTCLWSQQTPLPIFVKPATAYAKSGGVNGRRPLPQPPERVRMCILSLSVSLSLRAIRNW